MSEQEGGPAFPMTSFNGYERFARYTYDQLCEGALELDFAEIQDKLEEFGIVKRKRVDPVSNEWGTGELYVWIEREE